MIVRITVVVVATIVVLSISSALFRVSTAPDRVAQRRATAQEVCVKSGGKWERDQRDGVCRR